jgi:two-component system phosphate regulon response regulator PhoB
MHMSNPENPVTELRKNVLVIDDEPAIREMIAFSLAHSGLTVQLAGNPQEALESMSDQKPDLILMDWMLPDISGLQLTRRFRKDPFSQDIPIIMLTARVTEEDKIAGLEAGADDYVTKPFSPRELLARIKAVLRRSNQADEEGRISAGDLTLNIHSRLVTFRGEDIHLRPIEYRMLDFFMRHPERAFSRAQLLDSIWGANVYYDERTIDVHIKRLRKALKKAGCRGYLQTVRGFGYRFMAPLVN